jgi:hypothetical protein
MLPPVLNPPGDFVVSDICMNFYSSPAFLDTIASVYFRGRLTRVQDFEIDGHVYRFLVVGKRKVITTCNFLDYSEPLDDAEVNQPLRRNLFVPSAVKRIISMQEWNADESLRTFRPAPFVDFSVFPKYEDYQAYLMKRSKDRFKKNFRLRERLAEDFGELVFTVNDDSADVLEKSLTWKSAQLRETGLPDLFSKPENWEFYRELKKNHILVSSTLRARGRLLSSWLGYIHEGYWSGWIFTYDHDNALKKYSLGWQLMDSLLRACHEQKLKGFDFSIGQSDYKMTYGTHVRLLGCAGRRPMHAELMLRGRKQLSARMARYPELLSRARRILRYLDR